mgnify:CR=1 FL=1|jgi:hypothetical protein
MSSPELINYTNELRDIVRKYMNDITDSIATGSAKTFDQYQRQVGQIEGLAIAERELLNLVRLDEDDDDGFGRR